jgi:putative solute:sodium symporter small subunit
MRLEKGDIQQMTEGKNVERRQRFAARVRSLMLRLLVVWFVVSFGFGILLVEPLNEIRLGGYKLGFWFAQQGSIFIFIALIFAFSSVMTRLERDYVDGEKESGQ